MANMNVSDDLLRCPITMELFRDPVLASDGRTYEREVIEEWIRNNGTSPFTRQPLSKEELYPNRIVKDLIEVFERLLFEKNYQFKLDVDVKKKRGRPLFQTNGKTIYGAEWISDNNNRPEIILLKIDGARARKEASFYVNLTRHSHIIRTFGFVFDKNNPNHNDTILLLQEYAPEGSLYELLQERSTVPHEKILIQIFLQIIEGMIYLAFNHVIHGDLACRNVLIFRFDENQPERCIVKITDFGLSRHSQLYSMAPGSAARTTLNIVPVRYAAPEVLSSNTTSEVYTEKSDVYSMGVLMWEAYSRGTLPWPNIEDDNDVIQRVKDGWSLQKQNEGYYTNIEYNLTRIGRNETQQQKKEEGLITRQIQQQQEYSDRKFAQQQQEILDRELAQEIALLEKQKQKEQFKSIERVEQAKVPVPKQESSYSLMRLPCKGRACARCANCRDWYWQPYGKYGKDYTKRSDATCRIDGHHRIKRSELGEVFYSSEDGNFGGSRIYQDVDCKRFYNHMSYRSFGSSNGGQLCACDDNQS
ncbi:unnamed protein product [Adineta steineri]|uniref:Uncharacterized protein n=1 Tax=Adineta steineri TaxID=433720 RepID=A0A815PDY7_9BILA|nr:unnamed protein product [Adineta steineri]CAF1447741.1 unnamed protein product [Adineta steineri]CAF1629598.1 unnamed protein product [Adineta steineri]CAF1629616.1 unnamed protein product [Adineta steineri]